MAREVLKLAELDKADVPAAFRAETYFDFQAHPFKHRALFDQTHSVCGAIAGVHDYAAAWLAEAAAERRAGGSVHTDAAPEATSRVRGAFELILEDGAVFEPDAIFGSPTDERHAIIVESGARVIGGLFYVDQGGIFIGRGTTIEPGVTIKGPSIIGEECEIRSGAYLRGDCILGDGGTFRGEIKNAVLMDRAIFPHPCYVGDSLCGYGTHFGNQATAANLRIFAGVEPGERRHLLVRVEGKTYDLGRAKMGVCLGDFSQVGCNAVADPGVFLQPYTIAYALIRLNKGFYGPKEVLKNKPMEHDVIERVPLLPL